MTVLAHLGPAPAPPSGWQCPACLTVYNPDVKACHCATRKPLPERIQPDLPIRLSGACTCSPYGPSTAPCPVHRTETVQVIC